MIETFILIFTILLATLIAIGYVYKKWVWSYWSRRGLETYEPHFMDIGRQYFNSYFSFKKKGLKHGGTYLFFRSHYVPVDLDVIKKILISDFDHFVNRGIIDFKGERNYMHAHLFNLEDQQWKTLRNKLSPTFTSGKIKMMFQTLLDTSSDLETIFQEYADSKIPLEVKDILGRYTTDVIGSVAFGIECNSLKNPNSEFRKFGKVLLGNIDAITIGLFLFSSLPELLKAICQRVFKSKFEEKMAEQVDTGEFFKNIVENTIAYREKNDIRRNDFLHLLLLLKNKGSLEEDKGHHIKDEKDFTGTLTVKEIAAQCLLFYIAGFDTSSTAMTFALYELAKHPDFQENLRNEIHDTLEKNDGKMSYDIIMKMSYLDKVLNETLRKHPPVKTLFRTCKEDFPVSDTGFIIKKNEIVQVPVEAIHNDPDLFPEPDKFDPERFSADKKTNMHPLQFIPFGEGPRMCIGSRFAQLQAKVGLTCVLNKFRVSLNNKTTLPLDLQKSFLASGINGGMWLNVEKI